MFFLEYLYKFNNELETNYGQLRSPFGYTHEKNRGRESFAIVSLKTIYHFFVLFAECTDRYGPTPHPCTPILHAVLKTLNLQGLDHG